MSIQHLKSGTDIRGTAIGDAITLTAEIVRDAAAAFAQMLSQRLGKACVTVAVGRDSRVSGPALSAAALEGLAQAGAVALDFGMCTTPAMYMSILSPGFEPDGAIMMTASHHPMDKNGMKFFVADGGLGGADISALLAKAECGIQPGEARGRIEAHPYLDTYCGLLAGRIRKGLSTDAALPLSGLHVVVDAGNGAGGFYATLLQSLGANVDGSQFLDPDGTFPNHVPNPENPEAMASLSAAVVKSSADIGVIFDADCDRAAMVDASGREINRNRLIALISAILLADAPGATIVTDSVTSAGLARFITALGGVHHRFKRGYSNVISEAKRLNAEGIDCPLAIETSGHAALRENHFLDDGMYLATLLIVHAMRLKSQGKGIGALIEALCEPVESVELRLSITAPDFAATGHAVIAHLLKHAENTPGWHIAPDNREGVRISFDLDGGCLNGWFLLRLSVHDPVLPINCESDVTGGVRHMLAELYSALARFKDIDPEPIARLLNKKG